MKRNIKNIVKKAVLLSLSLSMIIPASVASSYETYADGATLIKEYDFEKGFKELKETDAAYKIVSAGGQFLQKNEDERESGDRVDANNFVITGSEADIKYYTQPPANQPSTKYDSEKGTVFFLAGTYDVPELVKEVPSNVQGDEIGSAVLDDKYPVGTVVRAAATFKSALTLTNQFKKLSGENAVLAFWAKVPADSKEDKIAFIEFNKGATSLSFCYDSSLTRGSWHYYTYVIGKEAITTYVDGVASEAAPVIDGTAPADMIAFLNEADMYFGATNTSSVVTVEETVFDDVAFYDGSMTTDEVKSVYDEEYADFTKGVDISSPLAFLPLNTADSFTDLNDENPSSVETFNINGHQVEGIAVVENEKGGNKNGVKIASPFKGLRLEGATVGYWIQVEPKAVIIEKEKFNDPSKSYTGKYPGEYVISETVALTFMDTNKVIDNPKHGTQEEGFSYLYTKTRMQAYFEEGGYFGMNTGNVFEIDGEDATASAYVDESRNWHYMTLVMNNNGVELYCDGAKIQGLGEMRAPRFLDGYYRRISERQKISNAYGAFGGSGNQTASLMMSFLTYEDTDMYFGWLPVSESRNETSSPVNVTRMSSYGESMTGEEVAALYEQEIAAINELPEYVDEPEYMMGDVDANTMVEAGDALLVLQHAAKLKTLEGVAFTVADVDYNETVDAADALLILKYAAKIIDSFDIEQ